ncbi:MAG TPA: hypothetical protein VN310_18390 [Candidatus Dormibacteraeota bacterium]|nr:hypothetical protein [Candidatus Dormibacteraeota bacterium]
MAEVAQDTQHEFWRSPTVLDPPAEPTLPAASFPSATQEMAEACAECGTEFMIAARFCHTCGRRRPVMTADNTDAAVIAGLWARSIAWSVAVVRSASAYVAAAWRKISFPNWVHYLHFHEIKRWIGLPTAPLIAFMIGLGCVAGVIGVSLFYRASNLAEFQAIQMWRIEWLLAATASFLAGILLKKPSGE